ncbi:MAG TPA: hypothetical protein VHL52_12920 [Acidimicrobiia bacterium]|nr:hypothetical protein [Acidimicrobiia bacterium]
MERVDLVVVGSSRAAISLAMEARDAGLESVALVETRPGPVTVPPDSHPDLMVWRGPIGEMTPSDDGVTVEVDGTVTAAGAVALVEGGSPLEGPAISVPRSLQSRVHREPPTKTWGRQILVAGGSEKAAEVALELSQAGAGVVLARGNRSPSDLSRLTRSALLLREAERRLTILWHSRPTTITDIEGEPLVAFDDVGTPDLVFDDVVLVDDSEPAGGDAVQGPVWQVGDADLAPGRAWDRIRSDAFSHLTADGVPPVPHVGADEKVAELRRRHYNATITHFERTHSDLWVVRVQPDQGDVSFHPGQYASLGLGYWEPRADGARDPDLERKWENLVRRSYSISSPVFDEDGYLFDPTRAGTLEFYVVLVPASGDHVPGLTPRLALTNPGDRIYVGPRIVGRYTLAPLRRPDATAVFFATGTGEAPHNAMVTDLLRRGHHGPIVSVVCVRYRADLAYLDVHRELASRFTNYHYLPIVTREPDVEKLYVQDVITRDLMREEFGVALDPETSHVFLCGNPAMIGIPHWNDDVPTFPEPTGACQLLHERGFDLDRHGHVGNVHTEKYW